MEEGDGGDDIPIGEDAITVSATGMTPKLFVTTYADYDVVADTCVAFDDTGAITLVANVAATNTTGRRRGLHQDPRQRWCFR